MRHLFRSNILSKVQKVCISRTYYGKTLSLVASFSLFVLCIFMFCFLLIIVLLFVNVIL